MSNHRLRRCPTPNRNCVHSTPTCAGGGGDSVCLLLDDRGGHTRVEDGASGQRDGHCPVLLALVTGLHGHAEALAKHGVILLNEVKEHVLKTATSSHIKTDRQTDR